ncbi:hypothetical protein [Gilvimarinus xylanilyticus]|uniref:Adhesin n=1 Tax=Gilvimarinus xylanilyticus TaxID=2944139 RepID=A0A9X2I532_9GAMM|nr:hypothetical protein [Gilvimarinus xylanilyticus]MCP8899602.1 hypothetical protein [Gilvimarinus xylanilyticus]
MKVLIIFIMFFPASVYASLECKGSANGLDSVYVFDSTENDDLKVSAKTYMNDEIVTTRSGVAKYSSTVRSKISGAQESYYVFAPDADSFTELVAISRGLDSMGRSRPMPSSETGNFIKFSCSGSL